MAETRILVAKNGTLRDVDKSHLRKAGVLIVETECPSDIRLLDAEVQPMPVSLMLRAAGAALKASASAQTAFASAIANELVIAVDRSKDHA